MKRFFAALLFVLSGFPVHAQSQIYVYTPLGYQQITSLSAATFLTVPQTAKIAEICVETQAIRYRDDGTSPTGAVGIPVAAGSCFQYSGSLTALQLIQQVSGAVVDVTYYR